MTEIFELNKLETNKMHKLDQALDAVSSRNYIVGSINPEGMWSFSASPVVHYTEQAAKQEALRLARIYPGKVFVYTQLRGAVQVAGIKEY